jgi:UPF0755 protein
MTDGDWQRRDPREDRPGSRRRGPADHRGGEPRPGGQQYGGQGYDQHGQYGDQYGQQYGEQQHGNQQYEDPRYSDSQYANQPSLVPGYDDQPYEDQPSGGRHPEARRGSRRHRQQHDYSDYDYTPREHRHPRMRAWAPLAVLLLILGGFGGAVYGGYSYLKSKHHPAADYTNKVCTQESARADIQVPSGASQTTIAKLLFDGGVVASESAYVDAASSNQGSANIRAGQYSVCVRIASSQAVLELLNDKNLSKDSSIEVRSHEWTSEIVAELAAKHKWNVADVQKVIDTNQIGLPSWAQTTGKKWSAEGLLEPGTYQLAPGDTPKSVLSAMVKARTDWLTSIDFNDKARLLKCGTAACTPEQVLTVASIAESEVDQAQPDGQEVSEAILAHLKAGDSLKVDSTVMYYLQSRKPPTAAQVKDPKNPYSTYAYKGLPPGPVAIPSRDMITAVLTPTHSGAYYWCSKDAGTKFYPVNQFAEQQKYCSS